MSSSQIIGLINPMRLRLGIKRAFTGDICEILSELLQNSQRAGARNVQITTDDSGFIYQDEVAACVMRLTLKLSSNSGNQDGINRLKKSSSQWDLVFTAC